MPPEGGPTVLLGIYCKSDSQHSSHDVSFGPRRRMLRLAPSPATTAPPPSPPAAPRLQIKTEMRGIQQSCAMHTEPRRAQELQCRAPHRAHPNARLPLDTPHPVSKARISAPSAAADSLTAWLWNRFKAPAKNGRTIFTCDIQMCSEIAQQWRA